MDKQDKEAVGKSWEVVGSFDSEKNLILNMGMPKLPEGWILWHAGQEPLFCLWNVTLYNIGKQESIISEEKDTFHEALFEALEKIKDGGEKLP